MKPTFEFVLKTRSNGGVIQIIKNKIYRIIQCPELIEKWWDLGTYYRSTNHIRIFLGSFKQLVDYSKYKKVYHERLIKAISKTILHEHRHYIIHTIMKIPTEKQHWVFDKLKWSTCYVKNVRKWILSLIGIIKKRKAYFVQIAVRWEK